MTQPHDSSSPATPDRLAADEPSTPRLTASVPEPGTASVPEPSARATKGTWRQLVPLVGVLAFVVVLSVVTGTFGVVGFVLAILGVVMVHEGGHFVAAKLSGMKVTEYFVGFGPRLWSIRRGETEYGVKALPLGGYVKIIGMSNIERDIDPADEPRTYRQQSYPKRMVVAAAGIATHFLIAVVVLTFAWTVVGIPSDDKATKVGDLSTQSTGPTPAQKAGFQIGDRIVAVDGKPLTDWRDLRPYIEARPDQAITFAVERDGKLLSLTATPERVTEAGTTQARIGIGPEVRSETVSLPAGVFKAVKETGDLAWRSIGALGAFLSPHSLGNYAKLVTGGNTNQSKQEADASRPVSVVGVARIAGQAADTGILNVLELFVVFNIFLGVLNLVPLLPFDGGHMAIATYERLRSRSGRRYQADVAKMMPFAAATVVVLLMLGSVSIYLDIFRPLANPFQ